jgi:hypothetical protein
LKEKEIPKEEVIRAALPKMPAPQPIEAASQLQKEKQKTLY